MEALVRDVSERKKLDDQTRDLYHQLLQAEKMAALGQTISGVAHELNNPLATILTWAERLSPRQLGRDHARAASRRSSSESERAARIVRNLLTFARKRHTTRTMVDLNQVVRETLALRSYEQRVTNITVIDALAAGLPQVFADPHQVQQVLLNLVINAEQAMLSANGRGTLVVRTWHDADRDTVVLEINDDGPGVPEEVQPKIFDPFFTTKEVGKGTGLGLTVAYAIVQEHGGRIRVESTAGAGAPRSSSSCRPATRRWCGRPSATAEAIKDVVPQGARVLVVEDEPALAAAVVEALADAGFSVDRAGDGEEALARVRRARLRPGGLRPQDAARGRQTFYRAIAATKPALARRVIFVTATSPAPRRSVSSRRAAAAGWPSRSGSPTCSGPPARCWHRATPPPPRAAPRWPAPSPAWARAAPPSPSSASARTAARPRRGRHARRERRDDRRVASGAPSAEHLAQPLDGAGVQLRHARLVHADLGADLLHRHFAEVVEADQLPLARRQRRDGRAHAVAAPRVRSYAASGASGSDGTSAAGSRSRRGGPPTPAATWTRWC